MLSWNPEEGQDPNYIKNAIFGVLDNPPNLLEPFDQCILFNMEGTRGAEVATLLERNLREIANDAFSFILVCVHRGRRIRHSTEISSHTLERISDY